MIRTDRVISHTAACCHRVQAFPFRFLRFVKYTPATHRSHLPSSTLIDQEDEKQSSDGFTLSGPIVQVFGRLSDYLFQGRHIR